MKRESWVTAGIAAALAFLIGYGAVGCMISGFELPMEDGSRTVLICAAASVFCAAAFSLKWGGGLVLGALTLSAGILWHRGNGMQPLLGVVQYIFSVYESAYGWGFSRLAGLSLGAWTADIPMVCLGVLLSAAITWSVCRRVWPVFPAAVSLLPLCACMVVTDTVPEEKYLFCLILGLVLLLITGRVRMHSASQGNRLTAMAALPAALALLALFLAFPQASYVNRSEATREAILSWFRSIPEKVERTAQDIAAPSAPSDQPERVALASLGRRTESPASVMEVTADVGGTLYLRGQDYDVYDAMSWTSTGSRAEGFSLSGEDYGNVSIRTAGSQPLLYLPYYPGEGTTLVGGKLDNTRLYTEYVIPRAGLPDDWRVRAVSAAQSAPSPDSVYLALPDGTRSRAEALLADILEGVSTPVEKAEKIRDYVRSCAWYDLNPSRMPEGEPDFALWFLEHGEAGYCVHFATAATVLLRAAGVEARYVSGYLIKTLPGTAADVTGKNAHAWAEYYEPTLGVWLVLEATPAGAAAEQPPVSADASQIPSTAPTQSTAAPSTAPSTAPPAETAPSAEPAPTAPSRRGVGILPLLLVPVLLIGLTAVQRPLRIRLRRLRQQAAPPNARCLAMWQEVSRLSALLGQTPPEALEMLAQRAKFSQHTLTPEELQQFTDYLAAARRQLAQRPWYRKLVYRYVYAVI